jgi:hypothetical protein
MRNRGPLTAPSIMKRHPLTGEPIEPVGVVNNRVVWPIMGGALDDDDDDSKDDDNDDDAGTDDGDDDKSGGDDSGAPSVEELARQLADTERRMKAADKRADAAEKKVKDAEKAEQDELTRAKTELEEKEAELKELRGTLTSLRLSNAFLTANKHAWHDPDTALSLAQSGGYLEDVVDEESGDVDKKALGSALDRLAKDKKYLIKVEDKNTKEDGPSGESGGGRSDNQKDREARKQRLRNRMPNAMR